MLKDYAKKYYGDNYNCAETIIRAANDYYGLHLNDRDMIMVGSFGSSCSFDEIYRGQGT